MGTTVRVNGDRIRALRERVGGSQEWLATAVGVKFGTVSRWERGKIRNIKRPIFEKLLRELKTTKTEICNEGPPLEDNYAGQQSAPKGQMNLSIDTASRNALALVAERYGVTRRQIVEIAPLLFFIAAEKSLQERKERLDGLRGQADAVCEERISRATSEFGAGNLDSLREEIKVALDDAEVATRWLEEEQALIEQRSLFGELEEMYLGCFEPVVYTFLYCLADEDFFADSLGMALEAVHSDSRPVTWQANRRGDGKLSYRVCEQEAAELVGGAEEAVERILSGAVALHEMPREIRNSSAFDRANWVIDESRPLATEAEDDLTNALELTIELGGLGNA